jgi:hypothetical protein
MAVVKIAQLVLQPAQPLDSWSLRYPSGER